jgi:CBS domain containing-hemolysin-like protein
MTLWLTVAVFALFFSAFFSASETAVFSIPREKMEYLKTADKNSQKIYKILTQSDLFLALLLLGNNFVNIIAISGLEKIFGTYFNGNLAMILVSTTTILLIFGEIIPKNIAVNNSMFIARAVAPSHVFALKILGGFLKKINSFNLVLLRMNYRYLLQTPNPFVTPEEYAVAIKEAVVGKKISESTGGLINSFINLSEDGIVRIARNRKTLKTLKTQSEKNLLMPDEIGVFYESDEIKRVFYRNFAAEIKEFAPIWFPSTKTIGDLHNYFLKNGGVCVLLVDEYGGFDGAASRYDIYKYWKVCMGDARSNLSEIIADGEESVMKYRDWFCQEAFEKYPDAKTLNGILCAMLGEIPQAGQTLTSGDFTYSVIDCGKTKINKIKIRKNEIL